MSCPTRRACPLPHREIFDLCVFVSAAGAGLAVGVEGWDLHQRPAAPGRLIFQHPKKITPRGIRDAAGQLVVAGHTLNIEILHSNDLVLINEFPAQLVVMICPLVGNAFMYPSYFDPLLLPVSGPGCLAGQPPL